MRSRLRGATTRDSNLLAGEFIERQEDEDIRDAFRFEAADDPFAGQVGLVDEDDPKCGREHGEEWLGHDSPTEPLPSPSQQGPHEARDRSRRLPKARAIS